MRPQMPEEQVSKIKEILLSLGKSIDVLEWGTGGSTVYFTKFLREHGVVYTWTGIEYNKLWYEKVREATKNDPSVTLVLFDVGNTNVKQPDLPMDEYVAYPASLNKKFDFILVDGRKRRRCLIEASKLLKPGGVVLLDDARRSHYHSAFKHYPDSEMLLWSGLWQGKLENPGFLRKVRNLLMYICFRVYVFFLRFKP